MGKSVLTTKDYISEFTISLMFKDNIKLPNDNVYMRMYLFDTKLYVMITLNFMKLN